MAWMTTVSLVVITLTSGYSVFLKGHWNTQSFLVSYIGIPIFLGKKSTVPFNNIVFATYTDKIAQGCGQFPGISFVIRSFLYDNSISPSSLRLKWRRNLRLMRRSFHGIECWYEAKYLVSVVGAYESNISNFIKPSGTPPHQRSM